jgi:hypothetical protein
VAFDKSLDEGVVADCQGKVDRVSGMSGDPVLRQRQLYTRNLIAEACISKI